MEQTALIRAPYSEKLLIPLHIERQPENPSLAFVNQWLTIIGKDCSSTGQKTTGAHLAQIKPGTHLNSRQRSPERGGNGEREWP
jgi:hypothetical protein